MRSRNEGSSHGKCGSEFKILNAVNFINGFSEFKFSEINPTSMTKFSIFPWKILSNITKTDNNYKTATF